MDHRIEIGKRIKELRLENNFSQTHIAEILFISQAAYSLIENSQNGIVADHIIKLSKLYNVSADYILTGDKSYIKIGRDSGFVPLLRGHAHAGYLKDINNDDFFDITDWFRIPGFDMTKDKTLFEVDGDSMAPTIFPGDILVCQVHTNIENVLDGSAVVIITVDGVMVKRIKNDGDSEYLQMENDNKDQQELKRLKKKDIKRILMVSGKISNVLIPQNDLTGNNKMVDLEESVTFLKKELFEMNKKLNSFLEKK